MKSGDKVICVENDEVSDWISINGIYIIVDSFNGDIHSFTSDLSNLPTTSKYSEMVCVIDDNKKPLWTNGYKFLTLRDYNLKKLEI